MPICILKFFNTAKLQIRLFFFDGFLRFFDILLRIPVKTVFFLLFYRGRMPFSKTSSDERPGLKRAFKFIALNVQRFYFKSCLLHCFNYLFFGNSFGFYGQHFVIVRSVHLPMANAFGFIQERGYFCHTSPAINVRLKLIFFIFHRLKILIVVWYHKFQHYTVLYYCGISYLICDI